MSMDMSLVHDIFGDVTPGENKSEKRDASLALLFEKTTYEKVERDASDVEKSASSRDSDSPSFSSSSSSSLSSSLISGGDEETKPDDKKRKKKEATARKKKYNEGERKQGDADEKKPKSELWEAFPEVEGASQNEDEGKRTIFVGNLPLSTTRKYLAKLFREVGHVQSARLRSVAVTGTKVPQHYAGNQCLVKKVCSNTKQIDVDAKSALQGYVVFSDKASVFKAIEQFNNRPLPDESPKTTHLTRRIRVDTASPTIDPKRSVFVGNLPYHADEASLQDHFVQGCGFEVSDVLGVRIIRDKETFQCKGFGYVLFHDSTMVATALQRIHESTYMRRSLRVKVCGKSLKRYRGQPQGEGAEYGQPFESPHKKKKTSPAVVPAAAAMRRLTGTRTNKRVRGGKAMAKSGLKPGVSRHSTSDSKVEQRTKKLLKWKAKGI